MSEFNASNEAQKTQSAIVEVDDQTTALTTTETIPEPNVSEETKNLVENKMADESDEIKHHTMALIEAIKKQAQTSLESAGEVGRENYVTTMRQAQKSLKKTGLLFDEQWESLEQTIQGLEDTATKNWEALLNDMQKWGDRVDRAVNEAWKILTEPEESKSDSASDSDSSPKS